MLLKAVLKDSPDALMATVMLPNDASPLSGELKNIFRTENSNSQKLGINRVVHVVAVSYCMDMY